MNTYHVLYERIVRIITNLYALKESATSRIPGFMDFNPDILERNSDELRIAISHYYKHPSGDMMADPDMELMVNRKTEIAEALTYQDTYSYQEVYSEDGSCNQRLKQSLNEFLLMWLDNLYEQGHKIE